MPDFIERLHKELEEVGTRYMLLAAFMQNEQFHALPEHHKGLLSIQYGAMAAYTDTLKLRIMMLTSELNSSN